MRVLSLFDLSCIMVEPWAKAGHECLCVDFQHKLHRWIKPNIYTRSDDISWNLAGAYGRADILFAFPPCTHLASVGAPAWERKGEKPLNEGLALFDHCMNVAAFLQCPYMIENPVGRIIRYRRKYDYIFQPWEYGGYCDPPENMYWKKTCLWTGNGFIMPRKKPVLPLDGSGHKRCLKYSNAERTRLRSETPRGFAQAVFEANERE